MPRGRMVHRKCIRHAKFVPNRSCVYDVKFELLNGMRLVLTRFQITATDMFASPDRKAGNLGFDPLSLSSPDNRARYELSEVIHGRAAMMGFSGIIHQMIITKQGTIEQMLNFKSVDPAAFKGLAGLYSNP